MEMYGGEKLAVWKSALFQFTDLVDFIRIIGYAHIQKYIVTYIMGVTSFETLPWLTPHAI